MRVGIGTSWRGCHWVFGGGLKNASLWTPTTYRNAQDASALGIYDSNGYDVHIGYVAFEGESGAPQTFDLQRQCEDT